MSTTSPPMPPAPTTAAGTTPEATEPVVRCTGLTKEYGDLTAVSRLDLSIGRGEIFGLLGPNGAGKTTTILMLLGLTEPTRGTIRVLGLNPARQALQVKRRVGYLPDAVGFYGDLTGRENLDYTAALNGIRPADAEAGVAELLDLVGLSESADQRTATYSRGMLQRLGIADALVKNPEVLILDEPTMALDPRAADQVLELIGSLAGERGVTVLLSSHLLTQVQEVCHRIGIFVRGCLRTIGTIDELAADHGGRNILEVQTEGPGDPSRLLSEIDGVVEVTAADEGWQLGTQTDVRKEVAGALQSAGYTVLHLRQRPGELSQIYRRYFTEASR